MITGFNTDVEHNGVVYHVQTEDKGLKSPLILSLVYVGGTILASKRTPYHDLIDSGFDENVLAERLQRQHRLICAAIHAGRIEDLKRQSEREASTRAKPSEPAQEVRQAEPVEAPPVMTLVSNAEDAPAPIVSEKEIPTFDGGGASYVPRQMEHADYSRVVDYHGNVREAEELQISLVDEKRFVAGEYVKIYVHIGGGEDGRENLADAAVTLKVLGSNFRPLIFSEKTGSDGIATFYTLLPYFSSGRAAILVSATAGGHRAELRRVIHQA